MSKIFNLKLTAKLCIVYALYIGSVGMILAEDYANETNSSEFKSTHGDFFHLYSAERTDLRAGYVYEPGAKEDNGPGKFDLQEFYAEGTFVSPLNSDTFFSFGGDFSVRDYSFKPVEEASTSLTELNLYKAAFRPGFGSFITDDILFWGEADLGMYSDFERGFLEKDDYRLLGSAQFVFRLNPGAALILGVAYSNNYLDQKTLPIVGLRLLSDTGQTHISIDFPFHARIGYYLNPYIETFTQITVSGDRYRAEANEREFDIGIHDERAGIGMRFWLGSYLSLTMEGGRTIRNELHFMTPNPGQFFEADISPHWYAQGLLGLAF